MMEEELWMDGWMDVDPGHSATDALLYAGTFECSALLGTGLVDLHSSKGAIKWQS